MTTADFMREMRQRDKAQYARPAVEFMPFPNHRTQAQIMAGRSQACREAQKRRIAREYGFEG